MRTRAGSAAVAVALSMGIVPAAGAQDALVGQNDAGGFRNVLPGGQGETVNAAELAAARGSGQPPRSFVNQLPLYRDLVYAAPSLAPTDLDKYFKSGAFGVPTAEIESSISPRPGVTIVRDRTFQVPRVYGQTRADTLFGAGYASAQDRLFMMDVLRNYGRARLSEFAGPGTNDDNVKMDAEQLAAADYTEAELEGMIQEARRAAGPEGEVVFQDLTAYVEGINAYIREARMDPSKLPAEYAALNRYPPLEPRDWTATDTVAVASLIGGIFGKGGGAEMNAGLALREAQARFPNAGEARAVFEDFRRREDREAPVTTDRSFPFDDPGPVNPAAVAVPDAGSVKPQIPVSRSARPAPSNDRGRPAVDLGWLQGLHEARFFPKGQSNALVIPARRSTTGRALAVFGPQVSYFSPQVLMELELHGPGIDARGAAFPGVSLYVLLGRGRDFAWSATSAASDNVDEFAEELCNPDDTPATLESTHYLYKGECRPFLSREHVIQTPPPSPGNQFPPRTISWKVERSVHGPIQGRATVNSKPVAIAEARSTYFHELESALAFKRLNSGEVTDPKSFFAAMSNVNFVFNWFYAGKDHAAYFQSGWFPRRGRGTDPSLPAWGTGDFDWQGFVDWERSAEGKFLSDRTPPDQLPQDTNPDRGYLISWNNKQAPGWRSADDNWGFSSVHRSDRLERPVRDALAGGGKLDLTGLTRIMALGATTDLRGQESYPLLRRAIGEAPDAEVAELLRILNDWTAAGSHRRDLDKDGFYEHSPAIALMDAWWEPLMRGIFEPVLGTPLLDRFRSMIGFHQAPSGQGSAFYSGWWGYLDKDLRALLEDPVTDPLSRRYCGEGSRDACRATLIGTLKAAAAKVREQYGGLDQARVPWSSEQIRFRAVGGVDTPPIPWQDRPTWQQVVEVGSAVPFGTRRPGETGLAQRCLRRSLRFGSRGLGPLRIGHRRTTMIRRAGAPLRQSRYAFRYCVQRGGTVFVGFSPQGDARLVMSAAPGHRARGVRRGTYVRRLRAIYRQAYRLRRGVLGTTRSSRIIFVTRRGRVRFVAVADRRLIKNPRNLAVYLRRALR